MLKHEELMKEIVKNYKEHCQDNLLCEDCPYEHYEDCLIAFTIDYLKEDE